MTAGYSALLEHVIPLAFVASRLLGLFMTAPMLNSLRLPNRVKVLLGVSLALATYPVVSASAAVGVDELHMLALAPMLLFEAVIGYTIGLVGSLPLILVQLAGYLVGYQMGLSLAQVFNPNVDIAADLPGQLLFMLAFGAFLIIDGPEALFLAVVMTFEGAPPGSIAAVDAPLELLLGVVSGGYEMAMRVAAPVIGLIMLVEVALGVLMRTIPQINILSIGFGLKILIGATMLFFASAFMAEAIAEHVVEVMRAVVSWASNFEGSGGLTSAGLMFGGADA